MDTDKGAVGVKRKFTPCVPAVDPPDDEVDTFEEVDVPALQREVLAWRKVCRSQEFVLACLTAVPQAPRARPGARRRLLHCVLLGVLAFIPTLLAWEAWQHWWYRPQHERSLRLATAVQLERWRSARLARQNARLEDAMLYTTGQSHRLIMTRLDGIALQTMINGGSLNVDGIDLEAALTPSAGAENP